MNTTPDLVAIVQREREKDIRNDHLAALAACARACCNPSLATRVARALHLVSADAC